MRVYNGQHKPQREPVEYGSRCVHESWVCVGHVHFMLFVSFALGTLREPVFLCVIWALKLQDVVIFYFKKRKKGGRGRGEGGGREGGGGGQHGRCCYNCEVCVYRHICFLELCCNFVYPLLDYQQNLTPDYP